jgi:hypothetical protein
MEGTMTDQGWGTVGGSAGDGGVEVGGEDRPTAPNVVPFPRDWIGPLDELVPIDVSPPKRSAPPDAGGFWDGDTEAVREAVSTPDQGPHSKETKTTPAEAMVADASGAEASRLVGARRSRTTRDAAPGRARTVHGSARWPLAALVLLVMLLGGAALTLHGSTARHPGSSSTGRHHPGAAVETMTVTTPVTVTTTSPPGDRRTRATDSKPASVSKNQTAGEASPTATGSQPPSDGYLDSKPSSSPGTSSATTAGNDTVVAGGLPDVKQTEEQP